MYKMRFNPDLRIEYRKSGSKIEMSIVTYSDTFMYQMVQQHSKGDQYLQLGATKSFNDTESEYLIR